MSSCILPLIILLPNISCLVYIHSVQCKDEICGCLRNDKVQQHLFFINNLIPPE